MQGCVFRLGKTVGRLGAQSKRGPPAHSSEAPRAAAHLTCAMKTYLGNAFMVVVGLATPVYDHVCKRAGGLRGGAKECRRRCRFCIDDGV